MQMEKGSLSIESENMFPIIKKWLYSDHDIFVRELVSNGCDAITKLKKLEVMGEYDFPEDYKASIQVEVSPEHKTLSFTDTGIGMTEAEVKEYINQVAFPVQQISWRNIRTRRTKIRSLVILVLVFILHLWWRIR